MLFAVLAAALAAPPVTVEVYQESLCPDSQAFIAGPLSSMLNPVSGLESITDLHFIPWGNAYYNISECTGPSGFSKEIMGCWADNCGGGYPKPDCYVGKKICQHGEQECLGNTLESCVIQHYPVPQLWFSFVYCFEGENKGSMDKAQQCASSSQMNWQVLQQCMTGPEGIGIDRGNAQLTAKVGSDRTR